MSARAIDPQPPERGGWRPVGSILERAHVVACLGASLAFLSLLSFSTESADAVVRCDRVASPTGSDAAAGTESAPFATAQKLIDALAPGDTGCLRAGTYSQWALVYNGQLKFSHGGTADALIRLTSFPGERARIEGIVVVPPTFLRPDGVTVDVAHVALSDLDIDGSGQAADPPVPDPPVTVQIGAPGVTLEGNDITNRRSGPSCLILGRYGVTQVTGTVVRRNDIHDCGMDTLHDHAIYVESVQGAQIVGNRLWNAAGWGVHMYPDAQRTLVAHNVIDGNGRGVVFGGQPPYASSDDIVEHNAITNTTGGYNIEAYWGGVPLGSGNIARENCLYNGNPGNIASPSLGFDAIANVEADPLYRDRPGHDYGLRAESPCLSILAPPPPGVPTLATGSSSPNRGAFSLVWTADAADASSYTLEHRDADDAAYTSVLSEGGEAGHTFRAADEPDGTWTYRVRATNAFAAGQYSNASGSIKVDRVPPSPPVITADRTPEYVAPDGRAWFRDEVTLRFEDGGDPALRDASAGSGVDAASLPAAVTRRTTGPLTATGSVEDRAGNPSAATTLTVQVDASAPTVSTQGCPTTASIGSVTRLDVAAADSESGLLQDPSGLVTLDTTEAGPHALPVTATDRVGHRTTQTCAYIVEPNAEGPEPGTPVGSGGAGFPGHGIAPPAVLSPTADVVAPAASLGGRKTQRLGRRIRLVIRATSEDLWLSLSGEVSSPIGTSRVHKLRGIKDRFVARGSTVALYAGVPKKARTAIRRALRRHHKVKARLTLTMRDATHNVSVAKRTIDLAR